MIESNDKVSVILETISSERGHIDYDNTVDLISGKGNNISNPTKISEPHIAEPIHPFIWGLSKWGSVENGGDGHILWGELDTWKDGIQVGGKFNGFWSLQSGDENGDFDPIFEFQLVGTDIDHFRIDFYEIIEEFPTLINVDGMDYDNDKPFMFIIVNKANTHTIQIKKWNKPNRQIKISSILLGLKTTYDRSQIKYVSTGTRINNGTHKPEYGVMSNFGKLTIADTDKNILGQIELGYIEIGNKVEIVFGDDIEGKHIITNINYLYGNENVTFDLDDTMRAWERIMIQGIGSDENNTALSFFNTLLSKTPETIYIDTDTEQKLSSISMPDGFIPITNLFDCWTMFCNATLSKIYRKENGELWII